MMSGQDVLDSLTAWVLDAGLNSVFNAEGLAFTLGFYGNANDHRL